MKPWLSGEPYYCTTCGAGGIERDMCEEVNCRIESKEEAMARKAAREKKEAMQHAKPNPALFVVWLSNNLEPTKHHPQVWYEDFSEFTEMKAYLNTCLKDKRKIEPEHAFLPFADLVTLYPSRTTEDG